MQELDNERNAFNNFLGVFGDMCITEKIRLTGEETSAGLILKLKTEWADLGIPPNGFAHPEMRINFSNQQNHPHLVYRERNLAILDFYRACTFLLEDLVLREKDSHRQMLFGHAEWALKKYLQRGKIKSYFFKAYPVCVKFAPHLPTFEDLETADIPKIRELLIEEQEKLQIGGGIRRLSGVEFFKNFQWVDKGVRTYALDPIETYETGEPDSVQFREDLERYAKLAKSD